MTSIQDALTEALEHPISEPHVRQRSVHGKRKGRQAQTQRSQPGADSLLWTVLGSLAGCLLIYGAVRLRRRS